MSDKEEAERVQAQLLFEGIKGRRPETDRELDEWLASPEGKAATAYELTSLSPWGEKGGHDGRRLTSCAPTCRKRTADHSSARRCRRTRMGMNRGADQLRVAVSTLGLAGSALSLASD